MKRVLRAPWDNKDHRVPKDQTELAVSLVSPVSRGPMENEEQTEWLDLPVCKECRGQTASQVPMVSLDLLEPMEVLETLDLQVERVW